MNHLTEAELIAYQMQESGDAHAIAAHLEQCAPCRQMAESIAETLRVFSAEPVPQANLDHAWQRLRGKLPTLEAAPKRRIWMWPAFIFAAALLLAFTLVAVHLHRESTPRPSYAFNTHGPLTTQPADPAIADHLDAAERLLTEVNNTAGPLDETTRNQASALLVKNAVYIHSAQQSGDLAEAAVLEDLNRVLVSVGHEPETPHSTLRLSLEMNTSGLLLDIRILRQNDGMNESSKGSATMKTLSSITCCTMALLLSLAAHPLSAEALSPLQPLPAATLPNDDPAYIAGTQAMDAHDWSGAIAAFDKVIAAKGNRTDAALYWKAYSLNKLNKLSLSTATCDQLRTQYRDSAWNKDCNTLNTIAVRFNPDVHVNVNGPDTVWVKEAPGTDDDIKMLAMNSLLRHDPAQAIPLLRGVLTGDQPMKMKKHALFVLAQSKSPEADSILHDAVTGKMDPELQREAIQSMSVFQGKRAAPTLIEVYKTTTDQKVKHAVISALFVMQDAPAMVDLARNEKDLTLKRSLVSQLALMNDKVATDYMLELLK